MMLLQRRVNILLSVIAMSDRPERRSGGGGGGGGEGRVRKEGEREKEREREAGREAVREGVTARKEERERREVGGERG